MRSLDVAAPAAFVDPLAPWVEPVTTSDKALAATFWFSFHGLSLGTHAVALFFAFGATLLPIPFLASMCATVKPVDKPIERVEMAIVELPKPPPPPALEKVEPAAEKPPAKVKPVSKRALLERDVAAMGVLKILGSSSHVDGELFASLTANGDIENALGGLVGGSMGDAGGIGGLGLRGTGVGGGISGRGDAIGIGSLGGIRSGLGTATPQRYRVTITPPQPRLRARLTARLETCTIDVVTTATVERDYSDIHALDRRELNTYEVETAPTNECVRAIVDSTPFPRIPLVTVRIVPSR